MRGRGRVGLGHERVYGTKVDAWYKTCACALCRLPFGCAVISFTSGLNPVGQALMVNVCMGLHALVSARVSRATSCYWIPEKDRVRPNLTDQLCRYLEETG